MAKAAGLSASVMIVFLIIYVEWLRAVGGDGFRQLVFVPATGFRIAAMLALMLTLAGVLAPLPGGAVRGALIVVALGLAVLVARILVYDSERGRLTGYLGPIATGSVAAGEGACAQIGGSSVTIGQNGAWATLWRGVPPVAVDARILAQLLPRACSRG